MPEFSGIFHLFSFLDRVAGQPYTEFLEYLSVHLAEHHGRMYLAAVEFRQLLEGLAAVIVMVAEHRDGYQHFICMEAGIVAVKE